MVAADGWTELAALAALGAVVIGGITILVTVCLDKRRAAESRKTLAFQRLREARDLVADARRYGVGPACNDACGRALALLPHLSGSYPDVRAFVETDWTGASDDKAFQDAGTRAAHELDQAVAAFESSSAS